MKQLALYITDYTVDRVYDCKSDMELRESVPEMDLEPFVQTWILEE